MIEALCASWIDESPQWNLICFEVVHNNVFCIYYNELNLRFLKVVNTAHQNSCVLQVFSL